jgi:hypothetical protein
MMWRRAFVVVALLGASGACSAILGIGDLPASDDANQGDASTDSASDGASGDSGSNDGALGDGAVNPNAPRLLAPLSTSHVTSRTPTLHFVLPSGVVAADATVDLCLDRACTQPIDSLGRPVTSATTYVPGTQLPVGVVFWRMHAGSNTSPTWEFWVGARSAPVANTSWGTTLDVNGDGRPDVAVANRELHTVDLYLGTSTGISSTSSTSLTTSLDPYFGEFVAGAGDVNGDGYGDLLVAGLYHVFLYLGSEDGLVPSPYAVYYDPGGPKYITNAISIGDVNGDGYGDIAFSGGLAGAHDGGFSGYGVNVLYGGISALSADVTDGGYVADLSLTYPIEVSHQNFPFGSSMAAADVNGDGVGDLLATSSYSADGGSGPALYVYDGNVAGLPGIPSGYYDGVGAGGYQGGATNFGDFDGRGYGTILLAGPQIFDPALPTTVSNLGIFNSFYYTDGGTQQFDNGSNAGDLNGDGIADGIIYVSADSRSYVVLAGGFNKLTATPESLPTTLGSISPAGDINGDGLGDVWETTGTSINLYYGASEGLALASDGGLVPVASFSGTAVFGSTN